MINFKKRWEITKNWQFIHIFLGIIATVFSAYLLGKGVSKWFTTPDTTSYYISIVVTTIVLSYLIIKTTLWLFTKLYKRWAVTYRWELVAIFLVFALTGSSSGRLSTPLMDIIGLNRELTSGWIYWPIRILLIFPLYQILLVILGWIFGQYTFFKAFALKMVSRMGLGFLFSK